ncbi:hypothetical protein [Natrinema versiforme]|nr:hypothetical protein [Natrinema versiforme]
MFRDDFVDPIGLERGVFGVLSTLTERTTVSIVTGKRFYYDPV